MGINRRDLFKLALAGGGSTLLSPSDRAWSSSGHHLNPDRWGMLVDTTRCIGCRHCEWACKKQNELPSAPLAQFSDTSVFEALRRPDATSYTVVNRFAGPEEGGSPVYAKVQCMHCDYPACVSACLVGAFQKEKTGSIQYDGWKCMGCRYCMVACPFQVPAYEYFNALTPVVRKCTFCFERVSKEEKFPACAHICPNEVMTFGRRADLLKAARERMAKEPKKYVPHIYGEHEVGVLVQDEPEAYIRSAGGLLWGMLFLGYGVSHAALLMILPASSAGPIGPAGWFLFLVILTETDDIFQAVVGRLFGSHKRHRISPVISPNKTWEGFFGGMLVIVVLAPLIAPWLTSLGQVAGPLSLPEALRPIVGPIMIAILISIAGFFGDINMSAIKRDSGVKDSSKLLPGMGGVIDRVDSLTMTAPVYVYFLIWWMP